MTTPAKAPAAPKAPASPKVKHYACLEVTISGTYHTGKPGEYEDYSNVKIIIPNCAEEVVKNHVRRRYAKDAVQAEVRDNPHKGRVDKIRTMYIDGIDKVQGELTFVGKDIREMTRVELQDLATAKDLRDLPDGDSVRDLRVMRNFAYASYSTHVLKKKRNAMKESIDISKEPPIVVKDAGVQRDATKKINPEEFIQRTQDRMSHESTLTMTDLKRIADSKDIEYHPDTGFDQLYKLVYGKEDAA